MDLQTISLQYVMKVSRFIILFTLMSNLTSCNGQVKTNTQRTTVKIDKKKIVGGGCDGCELMYIGIPKNMKSIDTSAAWTEKGQKLLITGTVYELGGKIPAPNVLIYSSSMIF